MPPPEAAPAPAADEDDDETPLGQLSAPAPPAMPSDEQLKEAALEILNSVDVSLRMCTNPLLGCIRSSHVCVDVTYACWYWE